MHRLQILPIILVITCLSFIATAQGVALEFGVATVENIGIQQNANFSIRVPLAERFSTNFTYSRWRGQDKDYERDFEDPDRSSEIQYYGNAALHLLFVGEVIRFGKSSWNIGGGPGLYQFLELDGFNNQNTLYRSYFSAVTTLRFPISNKSVFFLKALSGFRGNGVTPRWGVFTAGIEIEIY